MEYLLKANAIVILFYLCYKLFLQHETFFESNRYFLLLGLIIASLIPFIVIPIYIEKTTALNVDFSNLNIVTQNETVETFNYLQILEWLYLAGLTFFAFKFIIELSSLLTILFNSKRKKQGAFTYIETNKNHSPFSFFKYIVYNPIQFSIEELEQVILHEKIHAKQFHTIDILMTKVASILFWFNPFIWFYNKSLQQNLEFIADNKTNDKVKNTESYQNLLLKTSLSNHQLALVNNFYNSLIKKRIIMLHKSKSKQLNLWKYTLVIPFLALFLMSFSTKEIYTENVIPGEEYIINANTQKETLNTIIGHLEAEANDLKINFSNRKRNANGELTNLSIETKLKGQKRFNHNITYSGNESKPISSFVVKIKNNELHFGNIEETMVMRVTSRGVVADKFPLANENKFKAEATNIIKHRKEVEMAAISKASSKEDLKKIQSQFSTYGVTLSFSGIKRNTKNEITAIKANFKTSEGSKGNYAVSGNKAIRPFTFFYNSETSEAGFGTVNEHTTSEDENHFTFKTTGTIHKVQSTGNGNNVFVISEEHSEEHEEDNEVDYIVKDKEGKHKVHKLKKVDNDRVLVIEEGGHRTEEIIITEDEKGNIIKKEIIKSHSKVDRDQKVVELKKGKNKVMFSNDSDANPLIYIDGKKSSQEKMDAIDPDAIETISILKGKAAIEKYGKKAKDGVIEITLKK